MAHAPEYDYMFRLVMIGDVGVGKTSLYEGYSHDQYPPPLVIPNIGIDFHVRTITLEGKRVKLEVGDTGGQERFVTLPDGYYNGASGILLVYDVTDEYSFQNVGTWLDDIRKSTSENVQVIILGNKTDLTETREVSTERGRKMAEEHSLKFMETSAQTGENVELAFLTLVKDTCIKYLETEESNTTSATNNDRSTARRTIWSSCSLC